MKRRIRVTKYVQVVFEAVVEVPEDLSAASGPFDAATDDERLMAFAKSVATTHPHEMRQGACLVLSSSAELLDVHPAEPIDPRLSYRLSTWRVVCTRCGAPYVTMDDGACWACRHLSRDESVEGEEGTHAEA